MNCFGNSSKMLLILEHNLNYLISCVDGNASTDTILENNTQYKIEIIGFNNNQKVKTIEIGSKQKFKIGFSGGKGKGIHKNTFNLSENTDSISLIINKKVFWFNNQKINTGIKIEDNRHILNDLNYKKIVKIKESKHSLTSEAIFVIEEDTFK